MIRKIKSNNKGFSLVELILAVVILAIVVSPLLHSFVTATNIFSKSRNMAQLTAAGQNILEVVDASPIQDFVEGNNLVRTMLEHNGYTPEFYELGTSDYKSEDAVAQVAIKNLPAANNLYDARVTFSRGQELQETRVGIDKPELLAENGFKIVNSKELAKFSNMDAVFTQKYGKENPDEKLVNDIISFFPYLANVIDKNAGIGRMDRMIEIVTEVDETNTLIFVTLSYYYVPDYGVQLFKKNGDPFIFPDDVKSEYQSEAQNFLGNVLYEYNILPGGYDYSDDLAHAKDKNEDGIIDYKDIENLSIFVMYYANYTGTDNIVILNQVDVNISTFIVKMNPLKPIKNAAGEIISYERITGTELNDLENNSSYYTAIEWVLANEYAGDFEAFKAKKNDFLYTNAPINLYEEEYYNYDSRIYGKDNDDGFGLNDGRFEVWIGVAHWYGMPDSKVSSELVKKNADPRIYNVIIELYPVNSCTIDTVTDPITLITTTTADFSEEPSYTLQGTKTN